VKAHRGFESLPLRQALLVRGERSGAEKRKFVNITTIAIWAVVILAVFGYLWWQGQIQRLNVYIQETREELRKCAWPSWAELRGSTVLIAITVGLLGLFVVIVDKALFVSMFYPMLQIAAVVVVSLFLVLKFKRQ
jgi:preprotein translocase SecE subunit